jgi:raffinose/stachyose/melibiose transport system substrate-binding protein
MAESVKLNLFFYKQEIKDALGEMAAAFSKSHPGITLELEMVPNDSLTVLKTRFASGNSPDIVQLQSYSQIFEFAKAGYLLDLTREPVIAKVIEDSKASVTYNGKVYALPMDFAGIGIIYNKKIFNKYGLKPPKTYSELKQVARTLKSKGITPFAGLLKANWSAGHFITLLHASLTASPTNTFDWMAKMNKGQGSWNDPIRGKVDRLFSIMDFYKTNMDSNAVEMDWNEQQAAFAGETAAMMVQGLWSYGAAIGTNPSLDAGFTPFPASYRKQETKFFADVDSTFAISSTIGPEKTEAAKAFLNWLSGKEGIKMWTEKCKLTSTFKGADVSGMKQPFIDLMTHVNENGAYPWEFAMYPSSVFEDAAKNGAQEYFFGKKTAEQVVGYIDSSWRKAVGK